MQLSVSTTPSPTDANLAARFITPSAPGSADAARATTGFPPAGSAATGFAEMLSVVAAPVGATATATPTPTDAISGGPLAGPAASTSLANFPTWLVAANPGNDLVPVAIPAVMVAEASPNAAIDVPTIPIPTDSSASAELADVVAPAAENLVAGSRGGIVFTYSATGPSGKNVRAIRPATPRAATTPKRDSLSENTSASVAVMAPPIGASTTSAPVADSETSVAANVQEVIPLQSGRGEREMPSLSGTVATVASVPSEADEGNLPGSPLPASQPKSGKPVAARRTIAPAAAGDVSLTARVAEVPSRADPEPVVTATSEWLPQNFSTEQASPLPALAPRRIASVPVSTASETEAVPAAVNFNGPPMGWSGQTPMRAPAVVPTDIVPATEVAGTPAAAVTAAVAPELAPFVEQPMENAREFSVPVESPTIQFNDSIPTRAEIFAAIDGNVSPEKKIAASAPDKTFLSAANKRVATHEANLGIDVAKLETVMPAATFSNRPPLVVAPLERALDVPVTTTQAPPASLPTVEPALVAHRAVDAVLTAVERFSAGDRHSVQLQFSVGGADLSVRVELRGEAVRTTFRTDSPELRNALAHEWQAASPQSADRSVRLTPPEFSSNHTAGFGAFSGDTASHQREARARRSETDEIFSAVASRSRSAPAFVASVSDSLAATVRTVSGTALHLSTLA